MHGPGKLPRSRAGDVDRVSINMRSCRSFTGRNDVDGEATFGMLWLSYHAKDISPASSQVHIRPLDRGRRRELLRSLLLSGSLMQIRAEICRLSPC